MHDLATDPEPCVAHEWGRLLSDPGTPACVVCGTPYADDPPRSMSDLDILMHEHPDHSPGWEEFGATPGSEDLEQVRWDAA